MRRPDPQRRFVRSNAAAVAAGISAAPFAIVFSPYWLVVATLFAMWDVVRLVRTPTSSPTERLSSALLIAMDVVMVLLVGVWLLTTV
jgi:hypothetical protein